MERSKQPDPQRVCTLLLARLLPETKRSPSRKDVLDAVCALLSPAVGTGSALAAAESAWGACVKSGWLTESPARLSDAGREELRARLGITELPRLPTWLAVQRALLGRAALGLGYEPARNGSSDAGAAVVSATHGLPDSPTLRAAVDRLAWKALGVDTDAPFRAAAVQRYVLRHLVPPDARLEPKSFRRLIAMRSVGATRSDNDSLRRAAIGRWLVSERLRNASEKPGLVVVENDNTNRGESSLESFAAAVMEAARAPTVQRFHDDRAFIGSIWEHMRGRAPVFDMPLPTFKERLVTAHRQRLLRMSRADLVQAMDPDEVQRSEARYLILLGHMLDEGSSV